MRLQPTPVLPNGNIMNQTLDSKESASGTITLGEPSLADVIAAIANDGALLVSRRRHWLTSLNRIAEGIGRPPESLPARLSAFRHHVARLNPVLMGIEPKSL